MTTQISVTIHAEPRTELTKIATRKLRKEGLIPATLYSKGKATNVAVRTSSLPKEHTRANVVQLNLEGQLKNVLMREVQVNPLTDLPLHFDFQEVASDDKVKVSVPLEFVGFTREQEKEGTLNPLVRYLTVVTQLSDLPTSISVDVSGLRSGGNVRLFDLDLPSTLKVCTGKGQNVALASLYASTAG